MEITRQLLDKIAHLARLEVKEEEAQKIMQDMSAIVTWMEQLNEVDTTGVEPLTSMSHEVNAFREDRVTNQLSNTDALKNAPDKTESYFKVPKVLE
jgi:aspartyl-tRNA(Asn)/glutamyl-tRNA(Gln) amidotransferase subunit C